MSDLTVPCPHCHGLTCWYWPIGPDQPSEFLYCTECMYHQWSRFDGLPATLGASGGGVPSLSTLPPHCTEFIVRRPPHCRLEYILGWLPAKPGLPARIPANLRRSLVDGLSQLGECPYGHLNGLLYTTSIEGHPGFRSYSLEVFDGYLEVVSGPGVVFLTVFPDFAMLAPNSQLKVYAKLA